MKLRMLVISLVCLGMAGCSARLGNFTFVTTKNLGVTPKPLTRQITGEDCIHQILGIPIGSLNPSIQEAMDRAIAQAPSGNAMTDIAIHEDIMTLLLYTRICMRVDGAVVSY
jgi:hypothetical protein